MHMMNGCQGVPQFFIFWGFPQNLPSLSLSLSLYIYIYIYIYANTSLVKLNTLVDRNGDTYTLCTADTFFGDMSGRLGNEDTLGDPGHGPPIITKIESEANHVTK